ncbi:hypothetical protein MHBO_000965 [Bonamia ostreae]|uniref:Uncharacterized protein n=1 Tax=Bonamia ostreae TaxID=126728 RepID=A0ABV2AHC1_9EUKA
MERKYCYLLKNDAVFANKKEILQSLWKICFYEIIDYYRRGIDHVFKIYLVFEISRYHEKGKFDHFLQKISSRFVIHFKNIVERIFGPIEIAPK